MDHQELKRLSGLCPQAYEHPLDKKALDVLQATPGLPMLVDKLNEWGFERLLRVRLTGSHLRVTEDNTFGAIHDMVRDAAAILDLPKLPEVYIVNMGEINAFTAGSVNPIVVLSSGAVDLLTEDELFFVIAHELGHVKSGHVRYYQVAEFMPVIGGVIGAATLGLGEAVMFGVQVALLNWQRMSEFTADRAGLLVVQQIDPAIGAMMKIAGLPTKHYDSINTQDFLEQARSFTALDEDTLTKFAKALSVMGESHPWTVMRANQFLQWVDSGDYLRVRDADHRIVPPSFCTACGHALKGGEAFCPECGARVGAVAALAR